MHNFFIGLSVALIASAQVNGYSATGAYQHQAVGAAEAGAVEYQLQNNDYGPNLADVVSSSASAGATGTSGDAPGGYISAAPSAYGSNQNIPYQPANTRGNSVSSSISYPNNRGAILIHRPAAIIVKRPPTKVVVNHPPLVVKPAPVVLHRPPAVIVRKVFVKHHPRPVKVEPVYVNVVKPPAEKYFVNEKQQAAYAPQPNFAPVSVNTGYDAGDASDFSNTGYADLNPTALSGANSAAASAGYQLLQSNQGLAALANLSGNGNYGTAASSY